MAPSSLSFAARWRSSSFALILTLPVSVFVSCCGCSSESPSDKPVHSAPAVVDSSGDTDDPQQVSTNVPAKTQPADLEVQDSLSLIDVAPTLPAELKQSDRVTVRVAYDLQSSAGCLIFVRPTVGGEIASGYGAHGSGRYKPGKGDVSGWFTMNRSCEVDGIRVTMIDVDGRSELARLEIPVKATWKIEKVASKAAQAPVPAATAKPQSAVVVNEAAPPIDAFSVYGERVTLEQYRGQVVLLDFWATWCGPCIAELPNVKEVFTQHGGGNFAIVGVSLDSDRERLVNFIDDNDMPWAQIFDGQGWKNSTGVSYGVRSIPRMYLLDDNGIVRYQNLRGAALQEAVDELVAESLQRLPEQLASEDDDVRSMAAFRIGRSALENAPDLLRPLMTDQSEIVKSRAAVGLALVSEELPEPLLPLLRKAAEDSDPAVSAAAFTALGKVDDRDLLKLTTSAFDADRAVLIQKAALEAVAVQRKADAVPLFVRAVDSKHGSLATIGISALGKIDADPATAALQKLATHGEHPQRVAIAAALHRRDASGTAEKFTAFLKDDDVNVRRAATETLNTLMDFDAAELLITALDDSDAGVRLQASTALTSSSDPKAVTALETYFTRIIDTIIEQLASDDRAQQTAARRLIGSAGPAIALPLLQRLGDIEESRRTLVCYDIGRLKNPAVVSLAVDQLKNPELDRRSRSHYRIVLQSFPEEARSEVNELAVSAEPTVVVSGLELLTRIADDNAKASLTAALDHNNVDVRAVAAAGLAQRWKDETALPVLKAIITEESELTARSRAIHAMAEYVPDTALDVLLPLTESEDTTMVSDAVGALAQVRDERAIAAVLKATAEHPSTAARALYPLSQHDSAAAARALATFLDHENQSVAQAARTLLIRMRHPEARLVLEKANERASRKIEKAAVAE